MKRCCYGHDMTNPYKRLGGRTPECRECRKRRRVEQNARAFGKARTEATPKPPAIPLAWPDYDGVPL